MGNILDRLIIYMEIKELNKNKVTVQCGLSNGLLNNAFNTGRGLNSESIEKILKTYTDLNADWLLTGRGDMLVNKADETPPTILEKTKEYTSSYNPQEVPLYDAAAAAGCVMLFQDTTRVVPIDTIKIPNLPKCDGAIFARGDSMSPIIKSGDIILYKIMHGLDCIIWGETYIICYEAHGDFYTVVKCVRKSATNEGNLILSSHNEQHQPFEIHISQVKLLAIVRASIHYNNM